MKKIVCLSVLTSLALMLVGCGEPVPPNKIALIVKTMGERSTNELAQARLCWAKRLPRFYSWNPGMMVYEFPLGLQDYAFTARPSYESPNNEAIEVDCLGGHLSFDVNIQMYIDLESTNLAEKLMRFINDHQLQSYRGEHNMLARWAGEKLRQFVREPLAQFALTNQVIEVIRKKAEMNKVLLARMNERFNKYGLVFSSAGIISPVEIPNDQKQKMAAVVTQEYANRTLRMREEKYMPLMIETNRIVQDGLSQAQAEHNRGVTESIKIEADALKARRTEFISLVGETNYVKLEQMLSMVSGLTNGGTHVIVVPSTLTFLGGQSPVK